MGPGWRRSQLPPTPPLACRLSQLPPGLPAPPPACRRSQLPLNVCRRSQLPDALAPARCRSRLPPPPAARASAPAPPPHATRQSRLQMVWRRSAVPTRRFSGTAPGGPESRPVEPPGLPSMPAGTGSTPRPREGRGLGVQQQEIAAFRGHSEGHLAALRFLELRPRPALSFLVLASSGTFGSHPKPMTPPPALAPPQTSRWQPQSFHPPQHTLMRFSNLLSGLRVVNLSPFSVPVI